MASGRSKHKGPTEATPTLQWAIAHVRPGWDSDLLILTRPPVPGPRVDPDPNSLGVMTMVTGQLAAPTLGRPLQPSAVRAFAQYAALVDPRCDFPEKHSIVALGGACPCCHLDLFTYVQWVREGLRAWPL
jgi:hypothetical protein